MKFSLKITKSIIAFFAIVFSSINYSIAGNILNCTTCNLERDFCKNCKNNSKYKKYLPPQIKPDKSNKTLSQFYESWDDSKICSYASRKNFSKWGSGKMIVKEAKRRGLNCNISNNLKLYKNKTNSKINYKKNKISLMTKNAEDKCAEIGFKKGTEKYGECVLKLLDLK